MQVVDYIGYLRAKAKGNKKENQEGNPEAKEELRSIIERLVTLIGFKNKVLIFLEPPSAELWKNLLSVLSHDSYFSVAKFTEGGGSSGKLATKTVVFEAFPAIIFCTSRTDTQGWADLNTRFEALEPTMTTSKYKNAIALNLRKKFGNINVNTATGRTLKQEVADLTYMLGHGCFKVNLPFPPERLADLLVGNEPTQGSLMRRINQVVSHLGLEVLWNYEDRIKWADGKQIHVLAEARDIINLFSLYDGLELLAEANGVRSTLMEFYLKVAAPAFEQAANNGGVVASTDLRNAAVVYVQNNKTTKVKTHRVAISRYLKELEATGWIEIEKHPSRPGQPLAVNLLVQPGDLVSVTGSVTRAVTELFAKPNLEEYLLNLWRGVTVLSEKDIGKNAEKKVLDDKFYLLNIPDQDTTGKIIEKISKVPNVTPNVTPLNNETNSSNISFSRVTVTLPQNSPDSNTLLATSNVLP